MATQVTVTGYYESAPGVPAEGTVSFLISHPLGDTAGAVFQSAVPIEVTLDDGELSVALYATDDATTVPQNAVWKITEDITAAAKPRSWEFELSAADTSQRLVDLYESNAPNLPAQTSFLLLATYNDHTSASKSGAHVAANVEPDLSDARVYADDDDTVQLVHERVETYLTNGMVAAMFGKAHGRLATPWTSAILGTGSFRYVCEGDSRDVGWFGSSAAGSMFNTIANKLYRALGQRPAHGYIPMSSASNAGYTGNLWTYQAGSTSADLNTCGLGLAARTLTYNANPLLNAIATSPSFVADEVWIHYPDGPLRGAFTFAVHKASDNTVLYTATVTPNTGVAANGGRAHGSGTFTRQSVYVKITPLNIFGCSVEGASYFDGNGCGTAGLLTTATAIDTVGFMHWIAAHFGFRTGHFSVASAQSMFWHNGLDTVLPDLIRYSLGTNDRQGAIAVATVRANINADIANVNAVYDALATANPSLDIKRPIYQIVVPPVAGTVAAAADHDAYSQAAWWAALDNFGQVIVYDQSMKFGGYLGTGAGGDPYDLTADNTHPTTLAQRWGGEIEGEWLLDFLGRPAIADGPTDVATPRTLGTGAAQAAAGDHLHTGVYDAAGAAAAVQANLTTEAATRAAADSAESAARVAADSAEAVTRASADTTNATAISTETTRATTAEGLLAPKASPTFTGTVTAPNLTISAVDGTGVVTMAAQTTAPSAPAASHGETYVAKLCGREMLWVRGANGIAYPVQPHESAISYCSARPTTGTGFSTWGSMTNNGTVSTIGFTEGLGVMTNFVSSGASGIAGVQTNNAEFARGSAATNKKANGFFHHALGYFPDASYDSAGASTGSRLFSGMVSQNMTGTLASDAVVNDRAAFQRYHVNGGRTDTNWWFSTCDAATEDKVDTTMPFVAQHLYEFWIYCPGAGSRVYWRIDDCTAGTTAESSTTTRLPTTTTGLRSALYLHSVDAVARNVRFVEFRTELCR